MTTRRVLREVRPTVWALFEDSKLIAIDEFPLFLLFRPVGRG